MREQPSIEKRWTYRNYECVIVRAPMGHLCGYMKIDDITYLQHVVDKSDFEWIRVHGGVTYAERGSSTLGDGFYVGFDCAHAIDDFSYGGPIDRNYPLGIPNKSIEFCVVECEHMVDQMIDHLIKKEEEK